MGKLLIAIVLAGCTVCICPQRASAYGADVHFNLTYVLCRLAGLPQNDALWIADADQSMDDNLCTSAYTGFSEWVENQDASEVNGINWHDFSAANKTPGTDTVLGSSISYQDGGRQARAQIQAREQALWARVPLAPITDENTRIMADITLGEFLHFEQDNYSHRQFKLTYLDNSAYVPYGPVAGHVHDGDKHSADYVGLRPKLANLMVIDSYNYIRQYAAAAGYSGTGVRTSDLHSLIEALKNTYTLPSHLPSNYELEPDTSVTAPTDQGVINNALSSVLSVFLIGEDWTSALPTYSVANKLPYDTPTTPLSTVKTSVQNLMGP